MRKAQLEGPVIFWTILIFVFCLIAGIFFMVVLSSSAQPYDQDIAELSAFNSYNNLLQSQVTHDTILTIYDSSNMQVTSEGAFEYCTQFLRNTIMEDERLDYCG